MNALEIFFIAIAFNCLMFFGLCVYLTFLNKKERKVKTTKFDHSYDSIRWELSQKKQIKEPLHYKCRSTFTPKHDENNGFRSVPYNHEFRKENDIYYKGDIYKNIEETPILFFHGLNEMTEEQKKEYLDGLEELINKSPDSIDITDEHWKLKEDTDYMKVTILDNTGRKCSSKDEV